MIHNPENFAEAFPGDDSLAGDRLSDLLADRALGELAIADSEELDRLLSDSDSGDYEAFDRIAASLELGLMTQPLEPLPTGLRQKVLMAAMREIAPQHQPLREKVAEKISVPVKPRSTGWFIRFAPTLAAAAMLIVAFSMMFHQKQSVTPTAARLALLSAANDVVVIPWTATEDPVAHGASGDVAWSNARQIGYMRFNGLPKNNPQQEQYQLWIFDPSQDAKYPVDGGVFNIDQSTGEAIIPISARLHLSGPTLFAITIEKPGGVVVSDRKRLPLLAKTTR